MGFGWEVGVGVNGALRLSVTLALMNSLFLYLALSRDINPGHSQQTLVCLRGGGMEA